MPPRIKGKGKFTPKSIFFGMEIRILDLISLIQVANILLAHAGRGGGRGVTEAAAEIARAAAQSWLAPLLDTACDRLAFVLGNLFDLAVERNHCRDSGCKKLSCFCISQFPLRNNLNLFDRFKFLNLFHFALCV